MTHDNLCSTCTITSAIGLLHCWLFDDIHSDIWLHLLVGKNCIALFRKAETKELAAIWETSL